MNTKAADKEEQYSKLEGLTVWGRAKAILMGKSRSRNLLVLGIFLVVMSGVADAISYASGFPSEVGTTLRWLGVFAFGAGVATYVRDT